MNIDAFISSSVSDHCTLLKKLYEFDRNARLEKMFIWGLNLLELEPYGGTILYNPAMSPSKRARFATTGGDDVHFSLVEVNGKFGDISPIVMTVPMASRTAKEANIVVGESLHDFLRLGCVHGFFDLEQLAYPWKTKLFSKYSQPPNARDDSVYEKFRAEFSLAPWSEIGSRLQKLDSEFSPKLRFQRS